MIIDSRRIVSLLVAVGVLSLLRSRRTDTQTQEVAPPTAAHGVARALPQVGKAPLEAGGRPTWRTDEVMVSAVPGADLARIAAEHGAKLRRAVGPSGYGAVLVPAGQTSASLMATLQGDPRVASADRMGAIYGAGDDHGEEEGDGDGDGDGHGHDGHGGHDGDDGDDGDDGHDGHDGHDGDSGTASAVDLQWHLDAVGAPAAGSVDLSSFVVAVLDTGVAYENYTDSEHSYVLVSSLASIDFVSPHDFVNDDDHPNDDHQHGTHIASLIAAEGIVDGVAAGVSLMPLKVLDRDNTGTEIDLIDAIDWAADHGADVINMSLTFGEGYAPSKALREALEGAHEAGVVILAAAGNDGTLTGLYPAASPLVIGVGASELDTEGGLEPTAYTNMSPGLDVMAPGGDLSVDRNGDGYMDGILAETIDPADLTSTGLWFYAGTSQATAIATGAVVQLLASGSATPDEIPLDLQQGAIPYGDGFLGGTGAGHLSIPGAEDAAAAGAGDYLENVRVHVGMLPYLKWISKKTVKPSLQLTAVFGDGTAAKNITLVGTWRGEGDPSVFSCKTNASGTCTVRGDVTYAMDHKTPVPLAWGATLDAAISQKVTREGGNIAGRPFGAIFVTDGLVLIEEALDAKDLLESAPLGISWDEATYDALGKVAAGYSVVDGAVGTAVRPEALLFNAEAIDGIATFTIETLDLDALGLTDTDLGTVDVALMDVGGTGISADPLGLTSLRIVLLNGAGISADPLGIKILDPIHLYTLSGTGISADPLGFKGGLLLLSSGTLLGATLDGYALGDLVADGGWLNADGYPGASAMMSLGSVGMSTDDTAVVLRSGAFGSLSEADALVP